MNSGARVYRYGLVSGLCMLLHNVIMIVSDGWHQALFIGVMESFCVVGVIGYLLHSRFTFEVSPSWRAFLRYGVAMAMNLPVSLILLWSIAGLTGWTMALVAPAATCVTILLNFAATRWAVLRGGRIAGEGQAC